MVDLTKSPYEVRTFRPALRIAGAFVATVGLLAAVFDSYWEPILYEYLVGSKVGNMAAYFVPYLPILLIVSGAYLTFRSMRRPLSLSKEEMDDGRF